MTNASRDEAEEIKNYLQNENSIIYSYLNGEHKDKPLTLKTIRNDLESKFPEIINKTSERSPARSDIRNVAHNNDIKMTLLTPSFNQKGQFCIIHIVPPKEGKERAIDKNINIPLNTADTDLAIGRINALQSLTKIAIEEYFDKNPNIQILTETKVTLQNGKPSNGVTFKDPQPGKITPEGKILFETLRKDILKPAYEQFNRYIYWETKIEEDKESGKYKITAQIKRNKDSEEFPENDEIMGKLWKFQANDKETATKFVHTLEENILRKEHSFSRDRPVEQFGVESMRLVTKKSLLETLKTTPEIEDLQEHLTKLLNAGRKIT